MALKTQAFTHAVPVIPTLTKGMMLDSSGVKGPPLQSLGILTGLSAADGSFSDINGYGQCDYDSAGHLYVADSTNNRIQRFSKDVNGLWVYESKLSNVGTLLGGGVNSSLIAIDRSTSPNQIHIAMWDQFVAANWIGVWPADVWPNLTVGNRLRQYGANANADTPGRAYVGLGLALDATYAVVSSIGGGFRLLRWNHLTGVLQNEETQAAVYARFVTDGANNWWCMGGAGSAEAGVWSINVATFTGLSHLDAAPGSVTVRRNRHWQTNYGNLAYASGRVYAKDLTGRLWGYTASSGAYADTFLDPGALELGGQQTGRSGALYNGGLLSKPSIAAGPSGCEELLLWSTNADNANTQSFLQCFPLSIATATWTFSTWSASTNTLKAIALQGTNLSGEKVKVRLKKNSGAWVSLTLAQLADATVLGAVGTFTTGDILTFELWLSIWDRLDGHATLVATRDKLSPTNVSALLLWEDPLGDVFVPQPISAFTARLGGIAAFKARLGGT